MKQFDLRPTIFFIVCALVLPVFAARVELTGFVPPGIDQGRVQYEYARIWKIVAPFRRIDTAAISVLFFSSYGSKAESGLLPEWGGGGAIGTNRIVVATDRELFLDMDLSRTMVHELAHIVLNRAACGRVYFPRWFHEGVAMALSGDLSANENSVISKAIFAGATLPLVSIDSVNLFPRFRAELAYAQSHDAVAWLIENYGIDVIAEIVEASVAKGSFARGLETTLQLSVREVEHGAHTALLARHGRFFWIMDEYLIWLITALFAMVSFVVVYFVKRSQVALLDDSVATEGPYPPSTSSRNVRTIHHDKTIAVDDEDSEFDEYADHIGLEDDEEEEDKEFFRMFDDDDGGEDQSDEVDDWDDEGQDGVAWWEELGYESEEDAMKG